MARHVFDRLAAFADGALDTAEAAQVDAHLNACASCREAWERYQLASNVLRQVTVVEAPSDILISIERALDHREATASGWKNGWQDRWSIRLVYVAAAALVALAVATAGLWRRDADPAPWDIVRLDQTLRPTRLATGEWVETDSAASASIRIGEIGTVAVAPNTRMQILTARPDEHRLHLAHGLISAEIVAPPRLFFVETSSSTVVDLGCAYTMEVDRDGSGMLRVTEGWAALEWSGRESLVPAGASALTRPAVGPGTPWFDDASEMMRAALLEFDFGLRTGARGAIDVILSEARPRDTLTLWHLLSRVDPGDRARVFDRMAALTPLPAGVDRDKALALDPVTLAFWRGELVWTW